jgi:hypothetical protein
MKIISGYTHKKQKNFWLILILFQVNKAGVLPPQNFKFELMVFSERSWEGSF